MAQGGTQISTLASLARRRAALEAAAQRLGLGGGQLATGRQRGYVPPPPKRPAEAPSPRQGNAPAPAPGAEAPPAPPETPPEMRAQMLETVRQFLNQASGRGNPVPPQSPSVAPPVVPASAPRTVSEALGREGIPEALPLREQFFRLAGRMPTETELAIFAGRMELERQLGRPPTAREIQLYVTRPQRVSPAFPLAFELPPPEVRQ